MINKFEDEKMEIRSLLDDDNYLEVLRKCDTLEEKLISDTGYINHTDFFFVYYDKSLMFMKFKEYPKVIKYANKAKLCCETEEQTNLINWLLMEYNRDNNINIEESLLLADEIEAYYLKNNKPVYASGIRVNKALLLNDFQAVKREIEFIKIIDRANTKVIDEYSTDLFNVYINNIPQNRLEIARLIKSIHSNELQHKLKLQLTTQLKIA